MTASAMSQGAVIDLDTRVASVADEATVAQNLPTRQPGSTGLTWGENGFVGDRPPGSATDRIAASVARTIEAVPAEAVPAEAVPAEAVPAEAVPAEARTTEVVETEAGTTETLPTETVPAQAGRIGTTEAVATGTKPAGQAAAQADATAGRAVEQVQSTQTDQPELDGLPVRVRQANLAPQLRTPTVPMAAAADELAAGPSPEAARNTMASLQLGWQRGRSITEPAEDEFRTSPTPQRPGDPPDEGEAE